MNMKSTSTSPGLTSSTPPPSNTLLTVSQPGKRAAPGQLESKRKKKGLQQSAAGMEVEGGTDSPHEGQSELKALVPGASTECPSDLGPESTEDSATGSAGAKPEETISPPSGPGQKKSVKHLECWYHFSPMGCKWSTEQCLYAHWETGQRAGAPVQVEPGRKSKYPSHHLLLVFKSVTAVEGYSCHWLCACTAVKYYGLLEPKINPTC